MTVRPAKKAYPRAIQFSFPLNQKIPPSLSISLEGSKEHLTIQLKGLIARHAQAQILMPLRFGR